MFCFYCDMHGIHGPTIKSSSYVRNNQAPLVDIRGVHRQPHEDGTYSSGLDEVRTIKELKCGDKTYDVFKFVFRNSFWFEMILSMTLEHCFTKTLAIYVSCARLVFHPFPNWLLVLSESRPIQAPDAGSVAAPLWWRLRIRLRDRHCCHNRQHLFRNQRTPCCGLLLVLYTT